MTTTTPAAAPPKLSWNYYGRHPEDLQITADPGPAPSAVTAAAGAGRGIRVCVVDSGVEPDHPLVGPIEGSWAAVKGEDDEIRIEPGDGGDACGHGTACASIIRRAAPGVSLYSVRVLGARFSGSGDVLVAGLRWAVRQRFDVINLSLSTTRTRFAEELHALADEAYFARTVIVASAHNTPVESFPWRFASVISVGSHGESDPELHLYNPAPPVEFFAPGQNVTVGWLRGTTIRTTGNSFATPYVAGLCARILSEHPGMTSFQLKNALYLAAANVRLVDSGLGREEEVPHAQ